MKFMFAALPSLAMASTFNQHSDFLAYMAQFGKSYPDQVEFSARLKLFNERDDYIRTHNASGKDWTLAHNQFSDLTTEEYSRMLGYIPRKHAHELIPKKNEEPNQLFEDVPTKSFEIDPMQLSSSGTYGQNINWENKGVVNPVYNQGQFCAAGYAFATADAIASANKLAKNKLFELSQQQIISCLNSFYYTPDPCQGGNLAAAMQYTVSQPLYKLSEWSY